jgi:transcriptional regulator with XRE-family HTH domain
MNIGQAIKNIRQKKKISQESLSFQSGIGRSHMYKIENNKISPTIETLEKIAASLNIKVSEMIKDAEAL